MSGEEATRDIALRQWCVDRAIQVGASASGVTATAQGIYSFIADLGGDTDNPGNDIGPATGAISQGHASADRDKPSDEQAWRKGVSRSSKSEQKQTSVPSREKPMLTCTSDMGDISAQRPNVPRPVSAPTQKKLTAIQVEVLQAVIDLHGTDQPVRLTDIGNYINRGTGYIAYPLGKLMDHGYVERIDDVARPGYGRITIYRPLKHQDGTPFGEGASV